LTAAGKKSDRRFRVLCDWQKLVSRKRSETGVLMAIAAGALGTAAGVTQGELEEGATQDVAERGEAGGEPVAFSGNLLVCHRYG
jgi:hypothetical protein